MAKEKTRDAAQKIEQTTMEAYLVTSTELQIVDEMEVRMMKIAALLPK